MLIGGLLRAGSTTRVSLLPQFGLHRWLLTNLHHRFWLRQLHEAWNPPFYKLGTLHNLRTQSIPEYGAALQVVQNWVFEWLYALQSHDGKSGHLIPSFLTALLRILSFGLAFAPRALRYHLPRLELVATRGSAGFLRRTDTTKVHVLRDLERYIRCDHPASLESGILFVK